jgi:hypothetical protein
MPYVQVWVDEGTCDGKCGKAESLLTAVNEARACLLAGESVKAHDILNEVVGVKDPEKARREAMENIYRKWVAAGSPGAFWEATHGSRHLP